MKKLYVFCLVVLLMAFNTPSQGARPFIVQESGSFFAEGTAIDTNSDGRNADLVITNGKGQGFAQTSTQSLIEWGPFDQSCNAGGTGSNLITGSSILRTVKGLVFAVFETGTNCFDGTTGVISLDGVITGGTGFYKDAGGTIHVEGTVYPVLITNSATQFGAIELKATVTWD
jgi:hypothetical protein